MREVWRRGSRCWTVSSWWIDVVCVYAEWARIRGEFFASHALSCDIDVDSSGRET